MCDRVSVNNVVLRIIKVIFFNILDIGCFFYIFDYVGAKFNIFIFIKFMKYWILLFVYLLRVKFLWKDFIGRSF